MPDMLVKLFDLPEVTPCCTALADQGIVIRQAMAYEKSLVVDWVGTTFGPGWASETDVAFANLPISCYIATENSKVIGFACYESTCRDYFGPTGVSEECRGKGIGKALFLSCLHAMAAIGYAYAIIGGAGPTEFYRKVAGAVEIEGSKPGIYRDMLKRSDD
jgi:GNAT superfamily N-acetyltransferase